MADVRCLVTGGAGFIGSWVTRGLVARGIPVVVQDSFIQYFSPLHPMAALYHRYIDERLRDFQGKVQLVRGDTRHQHEIRRLIAEHRPTHVIHLAALPLPELSNEYTEEAVESIVTGTINLLEAMRDLRCGQRFVYASSSMVYGDFERTPVDEEHPKRPKSIYGGAKLCGEIMVETFARRFGLDYAIVRPTAVYGPTDVNRRVSQIFVENALLGQPLVMEGGADVELDFTYVEDAADGIIRAAFEPGGRNEVFNISRGETCTLGQYAQILSSLVPNVQVVTQPRDLTRPKRGALDIRKAQRLLGYAPRHSLEEGLRAYVAFVRQQLQDLSHGASPSPAVAPQSRPARA